jgi:hypothetical protein
VIAEKQENALSLKEFSNGEGLKFCNSFKVKQVVTRNSIDEPESRPKQKIRFDSDINSVYEMEDSYQKIENMEEEN